MDKPTRSEYYKNYYAKNKDKLTERLYARVECEHCKRTVNSQNMKKHQRSTLCKSKKIILHDEKISNVNDQIKIMRDIKDEITDLKMHFKAMSDHSPSEINALNNVLDILMTNMCNVV